MGKRAASVWMLVALGWTGWQCVAVADLQKEVSHSVAEGGQTQVLAAAPFRRIDRIEVQGATVSDHAMIASHFPQTPDHLYTPDHLDAFLKALLKTGFFQDVHLDLRGSVLHVTVKDNRFLNTVAFEGNTTFSDDELSKMVQLKAHRMTDPSVLAEATQLIRDAYTMRGLHGTQVSTALIHRPQHRMDVVFKIVEGGRAYIRDITFEGNTTYGASTLSGVISSRQARWYRFFSPPEEMYTEDRVRYDAELLRQYYANNGFADVRIVSAKGQLMPNGKDFRVHFVILEGPRYRFGRTQIVSEVPDLDANALTDCVPWTGEGDSQLWKADWFHKHQVGQSCERIVAKLGVQGRSFVDVVPEFSRRGHAMDVRLVIRPRLPQYVERIVLKGNFSTNEDVIRRELKMGVGDPFSPSKVQASEDALMRTGFFEKVQISELPSETGEDQRVLLVDLQEKSTGGIQLSAGYSTVERAMGILSYTERNFLGQGRLLRTTLNLSTRRFEMDVGTTFPYVLGRRMTLGVDAIYSRYRGDIRRRHKDLQDEAQRAYSGYVQERKGMGVSLGYRVMDRLFQSWMYSLHHERLTLSEGTDLYPRKISKYLEDEVGKGRNDWLSGLRHQLSYDRLSLRPGVGDPIGGWAVRLQHHLMGLGGTVKYLTTSVSAEGYWGLDEDSRYLVGIEGRYGVLTSLGRVRFVDQFQMGSQAFPGFAFSGLGPRDQQTRDALGGRQMYAATAKMYFPLGLPEELNVKGIVFVQSGSLWDSKYKGDDIVSSGFFNRLSAGGGMMMTAPLVGKIGFLLSRALRKHDYDERETFTILWGADF